MYMRLIHFFVIMKSMRLRESLVILGCQLKFVICISFLLGVLGLYSQVMQNVYLLIKYIMDKQSQDLNNINLGYEIERQIVWPIIDFFMSLGILYLFYSLGIRTIQIENSCPHETPSATRDCHVCAGAIKV